MLISFIDEIKLRSIGKILVNKEKCYLGFLRLKIWEGLNKMRIKVDRCNFNVLKGKNKL